MSNDKPDTKNTHQTPEDPTVQREEVYQTALKDAHRKIKADAEANQNQRDFRDNVLRVTHKALKPETLTDDEKIIVAQITGKKDPTPPTPPTPSEILSAALTAKYAIIDDYRDTNDYGGSRGSVTTITHEARQFFCITDQEARNLFNAAMTSNNTEAIEVLIKAKRWSVENSKDESLLSEANILQGMEKIVSSSAEGQAKFKSEINQLKEVNPFVAKLTKFDESLSASLQKDLYMKDRTAITTLQNKLLKIKRGLSNDPEHLSNAKNAMIKAIDIALEEISHGSTGITLFDRDLKKANSLSLVKTLKSAQKNLSPTQAASAEWVIV